MESRFKKDLNLEIELRHHLLNLFCGRGQDGQSSNPGAVTYFHFYINQNTFVHKYNATYPKSKFISKRLVPPTKENVTHDFHANYYLLCT